MAVPDLIPHIIARYYCINKPISDFLSLRDNHQKSNDKVADLLAQEQCQAGGAPKGQGAHIPPATHAVPCPEVGGPAATGVDVGLLWKTRTE